MPVYQLYDEMPYTEMLNWIEFFRRRPAGWREDQRTSLLLSAAGVKAKGEDLFPSLKMMSQHAKEKLEIDRAVPKGLFLHKMMAAKGGDSVNWMGEKNGEHNIVGGSKLPGRTKED